MYIFKHSLSGGHIDYALLTKGVQIVQRKQLMSPCSSDRDVVTYAMELTKLPPRFAFGPTKELRAWIDEESVQITATGICAVRG